MANQDAADYLKNITQSILDFVSVPDDPNLNGTPGEYLATKFFLAGAIDCLPDPTDPCVFLPNEGLNQELQEWIREHHELGVGKKGSQDPANFVPKRNADPDWPDEPGYPPDGEYSDGSPTGEYADLVNPNDPVTYGVLPTWWLNDVLPARRPAGLRLAGRRPGRRHR
jgi:hypothetical protein